ncbi:DUF221-domain-containing protein [Cadophora sp. DSE1049]|nr:DUF221-domain-containing protein [Cadophora sp. DSE1049]
MSSTISNVLDSAAGKAQNAQGESLSTFLTSLTVSGTVLGVGLAAYTFLKFKYPAYYYKQSHRISSSGWKPVPLSLRMLLFPMPTPHLRDASEIDNYLFDRYLHTVARIFLLLGMAVPPILIPLNIIDGKDKSGGVQGLDRLSFANVGLSHTDRYWAHLAAAILAVALVCHILQHELGEYDRVRCNLDASELDVFTGSSILLISASNQQLSTKAIQRHFHKIGGGIHTIMINQDFSKLRAKLRQRDISVNKLETAETNLIKRANHQEKICPGLEVEKKGETSKPVPLWMRYLHQTDRPALRLSAFPWLPPLPLIGPRVDAIYHCSALVARLNLEIELDQLHPQRFPRTNSAFVCFNERISKQLTALALRAQVPPSWTLKHGTSPSDIIWHNVSNSWWQQFIRTAIVYLLVGTVTLGFAFPITIIGSLSQISYLANVAPWLQWIGTLPRWLVAGIQGVLPPVLLAVVTLMVPVAIRLLATMEGLHSRQATENHVQVYYFTFLFVQVFLNVSLSAGITTILGELSYTVDAIPGVLAQNLPKASNYFFSYILMYTFTTVISTLIQVASFVQLSILSPILDKTARQKWMRERCLGLQKWGTFLPVVTNIACLIYSVIAPLILIISIICFVSLLVLHRSYPPRLTGLDLLPSGLFYPTAIRQLFTGIYVMELCLSGLFFLVRDAEDRATCIAQAIIMIVAAGLTALFHYNLDHNLGIQLPSLPGVLKHTMVRSSSRSREPPNRRGKSEATELPTTVKPMTLQANFRHDEALSSPRPVIWIPKDDIGIADDEIYHMQKAHSNILTSNKNASIDERGKLISWGPPP